MSMRRNHVQIWTDILRLHINTTLMFVFILFTKIFILFLFLSQLIPADTGTIERMLPTSRYQRAEYSIPK